MVDTPKETNGDEAMEDNPSGGKAKHGRLRRRSKPCHINTGPGDESNPDGTKEEYSPDRPTFKQAGPVTMGYLERDNHTPPSHDEVSLSNDEFGVPEDPVEQVRFKRRLMATAKSLQRKQEQLKAEQNLLTARWTKILSTNKYGLDRPDKGHAQHNWPPQPKQDNPRHTPRRPHITTVQDSKKDT